MAKKWILSSLAAVAVAVGIVACGGGGGTPQTGGSGGGVGSTPDPTLSGVTAIGAPLSGATVTLVDSKGLSFTTTADVDGKYTFSKADIAAATPPFLIIATASLGDSQVSQYAVVTSKQADGWANITPLTSAVAALASPTTIPSSMTKEQLAAITAQNVADAAANVKSVIAPLSNALNLPASFDPQADKSFVANRTGADLLLDHLGVTIRSGAVTIANKMTVASDASSATAAVTISKGAAPTATIAADKTDTSGLDALAKKLEACFKVAAANRLTAKQVSTATLAADCQTAVDVNYLHNGQPFINRWASALNSTDMDGATFSAPVVRLRLQAAGSGMREQIAVNFNFKDKNLIGYTRPEVIEKQDNGSWVLVGNKRAFNFYAEAALTYYDDVSSLGYNNTNFSRVDSGLRLSVDPRAAITSTGSVIYAALDMTQFGGTKDSVANGGTFTTLASGLGPNAKAVGCVIVKGPGVIPTGSSKWQGIHPNGVLLKRPDASKVQDYMAIDAVVPTAARTAIDTATVAANGNFGAGKAIQFSYNGASINSEVAPSSTSNNLCTYNFGNRAGTSTTLTDAVNATAWESTQSSSTYVVELAALGARKNVLTGAANDATIVGRDVAWNTGPRYARAAPSPEIAKAFDNNPVITFEVFDTDGRLRAVVSSRYLGDVPPANMAKEYFDANRVSKFDSTTLKRYLSFADAGTTVAANQNSVTADWTTSADAWGADRIMVYSEIQRSEVGSGTGATNGIANVTGKVNGLWTSDNALATYLTGLAGNNFYWWNSGYAKDIGATACTGNSLISSTGVNVARKTLNLTNSGIDSAYYGLDQLNSACIAATGSTSTKAYVLRELGTRTYTDTNVRLYASTSNKAMRP
jgi:glucoamylase